MRLCEQIARLFEKVSWLDIFFRRTENFPQRTHMLRWCETIPRLFENVRWLGHVFGERVAFFKERTYFVRLNKYPIGLKN